MNPAIQILQENEIIALEAIYPQDFTYTDKPEASPRYEGSLKILVNLPEKITIYFVEPDEPNLTDVTQRSLVPLRVQYLPPVTINFSMPNGYPEQEALDFSIECCWMEREWLVRLQEKLKEIWENVHDAVLFHFADFIQFIALDSLGITFPLYLDDGFLDNLTIKETIFLFNQETLAKVFAQDHFDCGICLEQKQGKNCIKLQPCEHVFCMECLCGYFGMLIREGLVSQVKCPDPGCKEETVLTKEVLDKIVGAEMEQRYFALLEKQKLEIDPLITFCPLKSCQVPVRRDPQFEKLCVCTKCQFAFCWVCQRTWHGAHVGCSINNTKKLVKAYLDADEAAKSLMELRYGQKNLEKLVHDTISEIESEKWMQSNTQTCPQCETAIEKSMGCNHMRCTRCETHFCYLCGSWIDSKMPYRHFNDLESQCNQRLFDGVDMEELEFIPEDHLIM
ncbi:hypothetical protein G9A89_017890 [Geosiphon pyriformis]|nr:hypothetical protein G9A89_017890 [Geosiphon pyriformis]